MAKYLLIESRDPFESNDVGYYYELFSSLVRAGKAGETWARRAVRAPRSITPRRSASRCSSTAPRPMMRSRSDVPRHDSDHRRADRVVAEEDHSRRERRALWRRKAPAKHACVDQRGVHRLLDVGPDARAVRPRPKSPHRYRSSDAREARRSEDALRRHHRRVHDELRHAQRDVGRGRRRARLREAMHFTRSAEALEPAQCSLQVQSPLHTSSPQLQHIPREHVLL